MATNKTLHDFFTSEAVFNGYYLGVYPLDQIQNAFDYSRLSKQFKKKVVSLYITAIHRTKKVNIGDC